MANLEIEFVENSKANKTKTLIPDFEEMDFSDRITLYHLQMRRLAEEREVLLNQTEHILSTVRRDRLKRSFGMGF